MKNSKSISNSPTTRPKSRRVYEDLQSVFIKVNVAISKDEKQQLVRIVSRSLRKAIEYDFNKLAYEFSKFLEAYYCSINANKKQVEKFKVLADKYSERTFVEDKLYRLSMNAQYLFNKRFYPTESMLKDLKEICNEIEPFLEIDSPVIHQYVILILNRHLEAQGQINRLKELNLSCRDALLPLGRSLHIDNALAYIHILDKDYKKAISFADMAVKAAPASSNTQAYFLFNKMKALLYAEEYKAAFDTFKNFNFSNVKDTKINELYNIHRGYFFLLSHTGQLEEPVNFKLHKFINDQIIFSRDKSGANINAQVLGILYYLIKDKRKLIDKYELIQTYKGRYCRERAKTLFDLLLMLIKYDFKPSVVELRGAKKLKEFSKYPVRPDIEIVPFDRLWGMVKELLKKRKENEIY